MNVLLQWQLPLQTLQVFAIHQRHQVQAAGAR